MHDPLTVAFEIRRPWPRLDGYRTEQADRTGERWKVGGAFWVLSGRAVYWPGMVTVWHRDPSGYDHTTCHKQRWRWHIHHWRIQVIPLQQLRRRLLTRCAWCKGRSTKKDQVNISHQWDRARGRWWQGERGLYHRDCSLIDSARRTCVCVDPLLEHRDHGRCFACGNSRSFGMTAEVLHRKRELARIPLGHRTLPQEDR
ncbi:hypothetical protein [Streptomyces tauricus]